MGKLCYLFSRNSIRYLFYDRACIWTLLNTMGGSGSVGRIDAASEAQSYLHRMELSPFGVGKWGQLAWVTKENRLCRFGKLRLYELC